MRKKPLTKAEIQAQLKKAQSAEKEWKRRYNREQKARWKEEDFIEEVKGILSVVKPLKPYPDYKSEGSHRPHEAVLMFSDSQIGEKVQKKETGFFDYNLRIFKKELKNLYVALNNIVGIHRKDYRVDKLNIFFLGDLVEGNSNIYRGQGARLVTDVVEQALDVGIPEITRFLQGLAQNFKEIYVTGVIGNHQRLGQKDESLSYVGWDYVIMKMLETTLRDVPNITFDISKCWWKIVKIFKWKFYMEHGDDIKRYMSIPFYGMERRDFQLTLKHQAKKQTFQYFLCGW